MFVNGGVYDVDVNDGGDAHKLLRPLGAEADDLRGGWPANRADILTKQSETARAEGARLINQADVLDGMARQAESDAKQMPSSPAICRRECSVISAPSKPMHNRRRVAARGRLRKESSEARSKGNELKNVSRENLMTPTDIVNLKALSTGKLDFDYMLRNGSVTRDRAAAYADANAILQDFNKSVMDIAENAGLIDGAERSIWERDLCAVLSRSGRRREEISGASNPDLSVRRHLID